MIPAPTLTPTLELRPTRASTWQHVAIRGDTWRARAPPPIIHPCAQLTGGGQIQPVRCRGVRTFSCYPRLTRHKSASSRSLTYETSRSMSLVFGHDADCPTRNSGIIKLNNQHETALKSRSPNWLNSATLTERQPLRLRGTPERPIASADDGERRRRRLCPCENPQPSAVSGLTSTPPSVHSTVHSCPLHQTHAQTPTTPGRLR